MYETCKQVLANDLSIQPSPETQLIYQKLLQKGASNEALTLINPLPPSSDFPIHLSTEQPISNQLFVARGNQLSKLNAYFQKACLNEGQIVFIKGSAGRGKTALATQFVKSLFEKEEPHVGFGSCNAYNGIGDAFLPFRDIFDSLNGNLNWALSQGVMTLEQAQQQWTNLFVYASNNRSTWLITFGSACLD